MTAGYPEVECTVSLAQAVFEGGADIVEIGIPFSDPIADGPTIQASSMTALKNGMTLSKVLLQIRTLRAFTEKPVVVMGSFNPVLQYSVERFCKEANEAGIDGVIFPDLPIDVYISEYQELFEKHKLDTIFLVTPETEPERVKAIDAVTTGFLYAVSTSSITGGSISINNEKKLYLKKLMSMGLSNKIQIGFGISSAETFREMTEYVDGAIIGSAFIRALEEGTQNSNNIQLHAKEFVQGILAK
jgi:tryptophan synthase alpha chain